MRPLIIFLDNLSTISEILSNLILSIACDHGTFWNILHHVTHCSAVLRTCSFNLADWYSGCASHASLAFISCSVIYILAHVVVSSLFCSLGIPPWSPQRNDHNPILFHFPLFLFSCGFGTIRCRPNTVVSWRMASSDIPPHLSWHSFWDLIYYLIWDLIYSTWPMKPSRTFHDIWLTAAQYCGHASLI